MTKTTRRKIARGSRIDPNHPLSKEESHKRRAEGEEFAQRCRAIFRRVYPELVKGHYDWFIYIEPDSEDYVISSVEEDCFEQIRQKHPNKLIMAMRLNETGTCGRI